MPNSTAVRGFDVTYDVLLRLASAQESLCFYQRRMALPNMWRINSTMSKGLLVGFINKAIYILAYDKDLNLKVVQ